MAGETPVASAKHVYPHIHTPYDNYYILIFHHKGIKWIEGNDPRCPETQVGEKLLMGMLAKATLEIAWREPRDR